MRPVLSLVLLCCAAASFASPPEILAAVSFSMPKASLSRLAADAARCKAPIVFRGVRDQNPHLAGLKKRLPVRERYGTHLIARFAEDVRFLRELGAEIRIDPVFFKESGTDSVPRICLRDERETVCALGDVTLSYALKSVARSHDFKSAALKEKIRACLEALGEPL